MKRILLSSLVATTLLFPKVDDKLFLSPYIQRNIGGRTVHVDRSNEAHFLVRFNGNSYYDCLDVDKDGKLDRIVIRPDLESNPGLESDCSAEKKEFDNSYLFHHMNEIYSKMRNSK